MGGVGSGRSRRSPLAAPMGEEAVVIVQLARGPVDVDASIAPIVAALNAAGIETVASCSGHGFRPGGIALRDGREIVIARNFEEARRIDRLFPVGANGEPMQRRIDPAWFEWAKRTARPPKQRGRPRKAETPNPGIDHARKEEG